MEVTSFQTIKLIVISVTGLSRDALHIYTGLITMFLAALILRRPLRSIVPLIMVVLVAMLGETVDMYDDIAFRGYWRLNASLHDFLNTLFWPVLIFLLARYTMIFDSIQRKP
jgi:hypothetical protein